MSTAVIVIACSSSTSDGVRTSYGYGNFIDSPVQGLTYRSGGESGKTDAEGAYSYETDKPITFSIGDIVLGTVDGRDTISPLTLADAVASTDSHASNIARFLQTLDDDNIPDNGILITDAAHEMASGTTLNFDQTTSEFTTDPAVLLAVAELTNITSAGTRPLKTSTVAEAHLTQTLAGVLDNAMVRYSGERSYSQTCSDVSYNVSSTVIGSITLTKTGANSQGIRFSGSGTFLTPEGDITEREEVSISVGSNSSIDFTGAIIGAATIDIYDGTDTYLGTLSSAFTGLLDGRNLRLVTPDELNVEIAAGVTCDITGYTFELRSFSI